MGLTICTVLLNSDTSLRPNREAVKDIDQGHDRGARDPRAHDLGINEEGKPQRGKGRPLIPQENTAKIVWFRLGAQQWELMQNPHPANFFLDIVRISQFLMW